MADNRTISQLEAEGYAWIGCECCKARRAEIQGDINAIPGWTVAWGSLSPYALNANRLQFAAKL